MKYFTLRNLNILCVNPYTEGGNLPVPPFRFIVNLDIVVFASSARSNKILGFYERPTEHF